MHPITQAVVVVGTVFVAAAATGLVARLLVGPAPRPRNAPTLRSVTRRALSGLRSW